MVFKTNCIISDTDLTGPVVQSERRVTGKPQSQAAEIRTKLLGFYTYSSVRQFTQVSDSQEECELENGPTNAYWYRTTVSVSCDTT